MNSADLETVAAVNVDFMAWGIGVAFVTALIFAALGAFLGRSGDSPRKFCHSVSARCPLQPS